MNFQNTIRCANCARFHRLDMSYHLSDAVWPVQGRLVETECEITTQYKGFVVWRGVVGDDDCGRFKSYRADNWCEMCKWMKWGTFLVVHLQAWTLLMFYQVSSVDYNNSLWVVVGVVAWFDDMVNVKATSILGVKEVWQFDQFGPNDIPLGLWCIKLLSSTSN